jgi:hypothetical protein
VAVSVSVEWPHLDADHKVAIWRDLSKQDRAHFGRLRECEVVLGLITTRVEEYLQL